MSSFFKSTIIFTVITLSITIKIATGEWGVLEYGILYLTINNLHIFFHMGDVINSESTSVPFSSKTLISHLLLIIGYLFQVDGTDPDYFWLTITHPAPPPNWWPTSTYMNYLVFLPVVISWYFSSKTLSNQAQTTKLKPILLGYIVGYLMGNFLGLLILGGSMENTIKFMAENIFLPLYILIVMLSNIFGLVIGYIVAVKKTGSQILKEISNRESKE